MYWLDLAWVSYPLLETYNSLKYPRLKIIRHWLIFWYIFAILEVVELLTFQLLPFWSVIKAIILVCNWKPLVTEISYKIMVVWLKQGIIELKKFESVNFLIERVKTFISTQLPQISTQLDQNPYYRWIIWYLNNDQSSDQTKKIF